MAIRVFSLRRRSFFLVTFVVLTGCKHVNESSKTAGQVATGENVFREGDDSIPLWTIRDIPVCWINPTDAPSDRLGAVQEIVTTEYSKVGFNFIGWKECSEDAKQIDFSKPSPFPGVRISIGDNNMAAYGSDHLKGIGFMELDLNLRSDTTPKCPTNGPLACVKGIALHEFGHAIALGHERCRTSGDQLVFQGSRVDKRVEKVTKAVA